MNGYFNSSEHHLRVMLWKLEKICHFWEIYTLFWCIFVKIGQSFWHNDWTHLAGLLFPDYFVLTILSGLFCMEYFVQTNLYILVLTNLSRMISQTWFVRTILSRIFVQTVFPRLFCQDHFVCTNLSGLCFAISW